MNSSAKKSAKLVLEDGTEYCGFLVGSDVTTSGEVVFNTGMVGYTETLSDPSYSGQILVQTSPMIGNYGVPGDDKDEYGIKKHFESDMIHAKGLIMQDYSDEYSHWNAKKSLSDWLIENSIPAITGIDTRALTKKLRELGTTNGKITIKGRNEIKNINLEKESQVRKVSTKEVIEYIPKNSKNKKIILVDCGVKNNILRSFLVRGIEVKQVPWNYDFISEKYDGLFISNGPDNPKKCEVTIKNLQKALNEDKPIFGICLGSQLMALAAGADTYKMKYGHRSHNQPCINLETGRCYITSQNHGFAVDTNSLSEDWEEWFKNANDGTNEGIRHKFKPFFAVQFHPEAMPGPDDTEYLFDKFINLL